MSNFVVSARKYRPTRFDEVVGQKHVSQTLKNALQNDHLAHAFLFCGPRGVGKTTCARILAKVLNCQNRTPDFEACNACPSCEAFNGNASFNITELDAASNNSVEHIRALVEQVRFQPQQGQYKVFIIDEVHMLSTSAFNAFLKTLEEPPSYAIFILATTEKHKIIPTILSRCQIFDFRRIQVPDIVAHLEGICSQEGISADRDALHIIGQKADGALRDALSIFDRMVSFSTDKITYNDVIENLNILDYDYFFQVVDALLVEDLPKVLNLFDLILRKGFEADIFINGLAEHLRNVLVCKNEASLQLLEVSEGLRLRYQKQAQLAPAAFLLSALNLCNDCDVNYRMARNKRLHVEMALIKMTYINRAVNLAQQAPAPRVASAPPPVAPEKKTVEQSPPPPPVAPAHVHKRAPVDPPPAPPAPDSSAPAPSPPPAEVSPPPAVAEPPPPAPPSKLLRKGLNSKYSTPSLSMRNLVDQANEEADAARVERPPLTLAEVEKLWKQYAASTTSPTLRNNMDGAKIKVEGEHIVVLVPSVLGKRLLMEESAFVDFLRTELRRPALTLKAEVDPSQVVAEKAAAPKRSQTPSEIYDNMKKVNPLVEEMRQRFDLKPDAD
ncbi:MAG: DNA polymerase III subunit gamma/tau [Bacteroidota bacterium]